MASEGNRGTGGPGVPSSRLQPSARSGFGSESASTSGVTEALREKAQDLASTVTSSAEDAWDGARRAVRSAGSTAENAWMSMTQCMSRYPLATFAVGVGLGMLLMRAFEWSPGMSWSRRQLENPGRWDQGGPYESRYRR